MLQSCMQFTDEKLQDIISLLKDKLLTQDSVSFEVLNPDVGCFYSGEKFVGNGDTYIYRGYKNWVDLAQSLQCRMSTPKQSSRHTVAITYHKLQQDSFHDTKVDDISEKYGSDSKFALIDKSQESAFLYYYLQALSYSGMKDKSKILNLGINRADEFVIIKDMLQEDFNSKEFVGIDFSNSAIQQAKERFANYNNVKFYTHDINELKTLGLGRFDMLISIGTLQSTTLNLKPLFMSLVQEHLTQDASIILGFPNSRWIGKELVYGAKVPNYKDSELGVMLSDVMFCKKYLQQKKYRVRVFGKDYIFLSATKIGCCDE